VVVGDDLLIEVTFCASAQDVVQLVNVNHRTWISLVEWYLESAQSGFSFPQLATDDYMWRDWVNEYVRESKRILTDRRNTRAFSLLRKWGCDVVERKGNIEIELAEYDLDYPNWRHIVTMAKFNLDSARSS
jgi:hypothetical protein